MEAALPEIEQVWNWSQSNHLAFFGLTEEPFQLTPNRDFFFKSAGHTAVLEVMRYGIQQGEGFIIVVGEVGTGKTLLLRMLLAELAGTYETALIISPLLTPKELLQGILNDVGCETKGLDNIESLIQKLNTYLFNLASSQKRLAVIIDEAQNLPAETIEQLRLLSNFESDQQKWLQIILVGQPELETKLNRPDLRQLLQRITVMETLPPLTSKEMAEYTTYRLALAGRPDMKLDSRARKILWQQTAGIPRRINRLMGRALLVAYSVHSQKLTGNILKEASRSLILDSMTGKSRYLRIPGLSWSWVVVAAICLVTGLFIAVGPDLFRTAAETVADFMTGLQ